MSRALFSARAGRLCLWWGGAALALGTFIRITRELVEGEVGTMDGTILLAGAKRRTLMRMPRSHLKAARPARKAEAGVRLERRMARGSEHS